MFEQVLDHSLFRQGSGGRAASADAQSFVFDLIAAWPPGQPFDALAVLEEHPELWRRASAVVELAAEEFRTRSLAGERVDHAAFAAKFAPVDELVREDLHALAEIEGDARVRRDLEDDYWPAVGATIAGYRVLEELGRGSFARVYLAAEPALGGRRVVVKLCPRGRREARTLGTLEHRHVVPVYSTDWESARRLNILCMPYLSRATLLDVLERVSSGRRLPTRARAIVEAVRAVNKDYPFPTERLRPDGWWSRQPFVDGIVELAIQVADALAFVHGAGVCHGDIKPSNVLVTGDGRALLMDFNLSGPTAVDAFRGGTLAYMAPEWLARLAGEDGAWVQEGGSAAGAQPPGAGGGNVAADLFSLGAMLYHLLTGRLPFGLADETPDIRESARNLLERQRRGAVAVRSLNPAVDAGLAAIIHQCLVLDPRERPHSAARVAEALRSHFGAGRRCRRWVRRHRLATGMAALAAAGVVAAAALGATGGKDAGGRESGLQVSILPVAGGSTSGTLRPEELKPVNPAPAAIELEQGCRAVGEERYEAALAHLDRVLELHPEHLDARFVRGQARLLLGERYGREADVARYRDETDTARAAGRRARELIAAAREDFDRVGTEHEDPRVVALSAYCRVFDRNRAVQASAIVLFEEAISPEFPPDVAWNNVGFVQLQMGDLAAARASLERALGFNEHLAAAHGNLAVTRMRQGLAISRPGAGVSAERVEHLAVAIRHVRQALALEPACAETWLDAAKIHAQVCRDHIESSAGTDEIAQLVDEFAHAVHVACDLGASQIEIQRLSATLEPIVGAQSEFRELMKRPGRSEPPARAKRLIAPFGGHFLPRRLTLREAG